jgi:hypothetical protein
MSRHIRRIERLEATWIDPPPEITPAFVRQTGMMFDAARASIEHRIGRGGSPMTEDERQLLEDGERIMAQLKEAL